MRARTVISLAGLVVASAGALPSTANAGSYEVRACDAAEGIGGGSLAFNMTSDPAFENVIDCPTDNVAPDGIVSQNRLNAGKAQWLRGAEATFNAPAGNNVREVVWRGRISRVACHWSAGIAANWQLVYGLPANSGCSQTSLIGEATVAINAPSFFIGVACGSGDGCPTAETSEGWYGHQVAMRTHYLVIRVDDPVAPTVMNLGGPLASGGWVRGTQDLTFDASDSAGIVGTRFKVDTVEHGNGLRGCDYRKPAPCDNLAGQRYSFNTAGLSDGEHQVGAEAFDAAWNLGSATATLRSDNTPPARPTGLAVEGGDGWRGTNSFDATWQNPDGQYAPIVAAHYSICAVGDPQNCTTGSGRGDQITRLAGLQVPGPGDWMLRVWLEDSAGNVDDKTASDPAHLRFDDRPPEIAFNPQDPNDPTRVTAAVTDPASGPAGGTIELSLDGSGRWAALTTTFENGQLVAYVPDDRLRDGHYLLRAQGTDAAGNLGVGDRRTDGTVAELYLPLRAVTVLRMGVPKKVRVKRLGRGGKQKKWVEQLKRHKRVRYGRAVLLKGRLLNRDGQPIVGQQLAIYGRTSRPRAQFQPLGTAVTDDHGSFRYRTRALFSMRLRVHYAGTPLIRPAAAAAAIAVRAPVRFAVSRKRVSRKQPVEFRGRFRAPPNLAGRKLVEVQARVPRGWRTITPATLRTDAKGRFRFRWRFRATTTTATYTFRARIPRERDYPYRTGTSRHVRVTVLVR